MRFLSGICYHQAFVATLALAGSGLSGLHAGVLALVSAAPVMAPKCAMSALPPPCEQLQNSMLDMGAEVSLDGLREYIDRRGNGLVHYAFNAYQRQLLNWWPETLLTRYNELPRKRGADDAMRQCLVRYLQDPLSGGFPRDVSTHLPGGRG